MTWSLTQKVEREHPQWSLFKTMVVSICESALILGKNAITVRDLYQIPLIDECMDTVGDANVCTT